MHTSNASICGTLLCLAATVDAATADKFMPLFQAEILFEAQRGRTFDALLNLKNQ